MGVVSKHDDDGVSVMVEGKEGLRRGCGDILQDV